MTNEELNTMLYEQIFEEQEKYKEWLLTQTPEEVLKHAYEYNIREDIVLALEYYDLSSVQAAALLTSPSPLSEIFEDFEKIESDHMETVRNCIEDRADKLIEASHEALRKLPVYVHSASYAKEHGEESEHKNSHYANIDCRDAIEDAISKHYSNNRLDGSCVHEVVDRFGLERVAFVLANTVQDKNWDGRISKGNKEWAEKILIPDDPTAWGGKRNHEYVCSHTHPGLIDLFVSRFRKEQLIATENRPSVRRVLKETKTEPQLKNDVKVMETER